MGGLLFDPSALSGIPQLECEQILEKTNWLWDNRRVIIHHPLGYELSGYYKRRKGKYRIKINGTSIDIGVSDLRIYLQFVGGGPNKSATNGGVL